MQAHTYLGLPCLPCMSCCLWASAASGSTRANRSFFTSITTACSSLAQACSTCTHRRVLHGMHSWPWRKFAMGDGQLELRPGFEGEETGRGAPSGSHQQMALAGGQIESARCSGGVFRGE